VVTDATIARNPQDQDTMLKEFKNIMTVNKLLK